RRRRDDQTVEHDRQVPEKRLAPGLLWPVLGGDGMELVARCGIKPELDRRAQAFVLAAADVHELIFPGDLQATDAFVLPREQEILESLGRSLLRLDHHALALAAVEQRLVRIVENQCPTFFAGFAGSLPARLRIGVAAELVAQLKVVSP